MTPDRLRRLEGDTCASLDGDFSTGPWKHPVRKSRGLNVVGLVIFGACFTLAGLIAVLLIVWT